ncbi:MAG: hypothetical protein NC350_03915 [Corallococcus sp.]|nr:hypothetical protein [Corallococcus sp.]
MANELTAKNRERLNEMYALLKQRTYSKEELCKLFDTGERQVRLMVSTIAKRRPIITTSDSKGYRAAVTVKDYEDARHSWAELSSRQQELEERCRPLIEFCEKCQEMKKEKEAI